MDSTTISIDQCCLFMVSNRLIFPKNNVIIEKILHLLYFSLLCQGHQRNLLLALMADKLIKPHFQQTHITWHGWWWSDWFFVGPQIYLETNNCLSIEENEYDDKIMNKLCRVVICLAIVSMRFVMPLYMTLMSNNMAIRQAIIFF